MSDHPRRNLVGWILLALAGLALAVALSVTASNLSTQPIGLSAEPLRAGDRLAPASVTTTAKKNTKKEKKARKQSTATPTTTQPANVPTQRSSSGSREVEPGDDHGGGDGDADDD
jgi:hypothetical protein